VTRSRRAFSRRTSSRTPPVNPVFLAGGAAIAVVGAFVYLVHVADSNPPARVETRIELPNAIASQ
jgi:hypothetical protein